MSCMIIARWAHPLFLVCLLLPAALLAQDVNVLLAKARQAEKAFQEKEALQAYLQVLQQEPRHLAALCRTSELYNILGERQGAKDKQKEYYRSAEQYARQALQADPNSAEANFVMAAAMGRRALIESGEEKIKAVKDIREYALKAIKLDPNSYKGYHVLGKWHYEVSDLSALERWLVKVAFKALPPASLEEAISHFERSKQLNPHFLLNYYELARCRERNKEAAKAISLLEAMLQLPNASAGDASLKDKARSLLKSLQ
ncbi:MAG: hypothetical protein P0Y53_16005 [Candidatus Pseudobacter hemicellulosilyticus]|uniref:Regulator of microtubule dynamics protein 1 n=1 Tax=Candidatus Pseudobacter hemicellulosilyticus TaxID=3121375 RepID=A0AAJ5WQP1_9BACT|nr:MAG: hypothetical protein P0Y53_16005 [Pseudobacter sp.]